jgi:hypothetical protein
VSYSEKSIDSASKFLEKGRKGALYEAIGSAFLTPVMRATPGSGTAFISVAKNPWSCAK